MSKVTSYEGWRIWARLPITEVPMTNDSHLRSNGLTASHNRVRGSDEGLYSVRRNQNECRRVSGFDVWPYACQTAQPSRFVHQYTQGAAGEPSIRENCIHARTYLLLRNWKHITFRMQILRWARGVYVWYVDSFFGCTYKPALKGDHKHECVESQT